MARKAKKKKGTHHRRRHRIHGVNPTLADAGMKLAGAFVGGVVEVFANQAIKTSFPTMPTYTGGAVGVAAGVGGLMFGPKSPFIQGAAFGLATMGGVFVLNETFLSLPGISGTPQGLPNATPGAFLSHPVAGYRGIPRNPNNMGNMSGPGQGAVGALYQN